MISEQALLVSDGPAIGSPALLAEMFQAEAELLVQEQLWVVLFNSKMQVVHTEMLYRGNVSCVVVRAAEILRPAIIRNAPDLAVVHNHPSGDPTASPEDIVLTKQLQEACKIMSIKLCDHIIIAPNERVFSFMDRGLL